WVKVRCPAISVMASSTAGSRSPNRILGARMGTAFSDRRIAFRFVGRSWDGRSSRAEGERRAADGVRDADGADAGPVARVGSGSRRGASWLGGGGSGGGDAGEADLGEADLGEADEAGRGGRAGGGLGGSAGGRGATGAGLGTAGVRVTGARSCGDVARSPAAEARRSRGEGVG